MYRIVFLTCTELKYKLYHKTKIHCCVKGPYKTCKKNARIWILAIKFSMYPSRFFRVSVMASEKGVFPFCVCLLTWSLIFACLPRELSFCISVKMNDAAEHIRTVHLSTLYLSLPQIAGFYSLRQNGSKGRNADFGLWRTYKGHSNLIELFTLRQLKVDVLTSAFMRYDIQSMMVVEYE